MLGATAAATMLGRSFLVSHERGRVLHWPDFADSSPLTTDDGPPIDEALIVATVHPSAVLRSHERKVAYAAFADDLRTVAQLHPGRAGA